MNTANKLTALRVVLIPIFLIILYWGFPYSRYIAFAIFILASLTDVADGYIARSRGLITDFGKFMDPLADKALVFAALLWFVESGVMPAWAVLIVIIREFAVTALRLMAASRGKVIAADIMGKIKTAGTMVCIIIMFLPVPVVVNTICVAIIVILTSISGINYFAKNKDLIGSEL
jgi:CDP-diacylglycerol--glycerol-3-phosphate 3-phosphatidyltransferase